MRRFVLRWAVHAGMLLPLAVLIGRWVTMIAGAEPRQAGLSAEPIAYTINYLGFWALRALWLTLLVTPLRRFARWNWLAAWRRPLGLWCFAYAVLHLAVYFGLDQSGSPGLLVHDVAKHPFILLGMAALLLLLPLALTSTRGAIRALGASRWQALHRLVYGAAALAAVHFILRVKGFQSEPWVYAAILAALLAARLRWRKAAGLIRRLVPASPPGNRAAA